MATGRIEPASRGTVSAGRLWRAQTQRWPDHFHLISSARNGAPPR
jgi:hypothetical protein